MEGHFTVSKMPARGLTDHDFEQAIKEGKLDHLLVDLPTTEKVQGNNRIFDSLAGNFLDKLFSLGNGPWPYYVGNGSSGLAIILLTTIDGDTSSYTEDLGYHNSTTARYFSSMPNQVSGSAYKRFDQDQIEAWQIWTNASGREAIHFRNKFLYLPTQGVSNNIRSIDIWWCSDADNTGDLYSQGRARTGRIRLKDEAGNKIILTKSNKEILMVEYTFTWVAM